MNKKSAAFLLFGGGLTVGIAAWFAKRKSTATTDNLMKAIAGSDGPRTVDPETGDVSGGGVVKIHATGYWPYQGGLSATERKMEGGTTDRKKRPIITLEMHQSDPVKYPYVSLAGDFTVWPDGQRVVLSPWPNAVMRVVDTGGHFYGLKKVYRVAGEEPLDVAVNSSSTPVPKKNVTARIIPGDNFERGKAVATGGLRGQNVIVGEARSNNDVEALARAIESELGGRSKEEQVNAAWSMRNRADEAGTTVYDMLAPRGAYGSPSKSSGYASTRRAPTDQSREIARTVLDAPTSDDPTGGAVDFWMPSQQEKMRQLGDVHRAAASNGDEDLARKYEKYANYGTEDDVREQHARNGLSVLRAVGAVELLGRS